MTPEDSSPASPLLTVESPTHSLLGEDSFPSETLPPADDLAAVEYGQPAQAQITDELGVSAVGDDPVPATPRTEPAPGERKVAIAKVAIAKVAIAKVAIAKVGRRRAVTPRGRGAKSARPPLAKEDVRQRLGAIKQALDDVCPRTLKDWERLVRTKQHTEQDIALWTHMAATYRRCLAGRVLTPGQRREFFHLILACSTTPKERVLQVARISALSRGQAQEAVDFYSSPRA